MHYRASFFLRNIHKDKQELELIAQSEDEVDNWKASLLRAGVYPVQDKSERTEDQDDVREMTSP